ncbi:MAG: hypothetical protein Q7V63_07420 [Gammaproteobacteria bacterium]|nr:hypothetical protein [Gammaproteobacteria bacterium]
MRKHIAMLTPSLPSLLLLLATSLSGCATTVGQEFRDIMADIDAECKREGLGPYLDTTKSQPLSKVTNTRCDILKIKPADPLATEEGRFAYSIKLPAPHDKLKTEYSRMMTAESYFKELCEKDAGEWVFRTVEGVEGVFQGRRMEPFNVGYSNLVFFSRELSEITTDEPELAMVQPFAGRYNYFEIPAPDHQKQANRYIRFYRGVVNPSKYQGRYQTNTKNGQMVTVPYILHEEQTDSLQSRFGYTWRSASTKETIENGIAGSELIIFDRTTSEVLAYRRLFMRYWPRSDSKSRRLTNIAGCKGKVSAPAHQFIQKVLIPINPAE